MGDQIRFEVAPATGFAGVGYDLVTTFDALHDMGDPVGAARQVHDALADGRHLDDRRADGGRPGGGQPQPGRPGLLRILDTALHARLALAEPRPGAGSQAGPARIRDVTWRPGFTRFATVATTPFNNVFEVRK